MKYFKGLLAGALALTLVGCTSEKTEPKQETIKILVPNGATALSMLGIYGESNVTIDTVDGTDVISAELSKKDSNYDAIVAPINLGATLSSKGKSEFVLDQVVTWGNLYIVGSDESALTKEGDFAAFGEKAVPQKVLTSSMDLKNMKPQVTYYNSVNDVQQQLLSKKSAVGMLAEPAATATIAKAKEKGISLKILKDLQKEYQTTNESSSKGYPQAALFVKKGSEDKISSYVTKAATFANETAKSKDKAILDAVEKATVEKLGVPNAQIVVKTWTRLNVNFVKANTVKDDITTFLKQFNITLSAEGYTK